MNTIRNWYEPDYDWTDYNNATHVTQVFVSTPWDPAGPDQTEFVRPMSPTEYPTVWHYVMQEVPIEGKDESFFGFRLTFNRPVSLAGFNIFKWTASGAVDISTRDETYEPCKIRVQRFNEGGQEGETVFEQVYGTDLTWDYWQVDFPVLVPYAEASDVWEIGFNKAGNLSNGFGVTDTQRMEIQHGPYGEPSGDTPYGIALWEATGDPEPPTQTFNIQLSGPTMNSRLCFTDY